MTHDDNLSTLLERAAGPEPGSGDSADVRRRARRYTRRRRAGLTVGVVALVLPALFAAGKLQSGDDKHEPSVLASDDTANVESGETLFERPLPGGETLSVSSTDDPSQVAVRISGVEGAQAIPIQAGVITGRAGNQQVPWDIVAMVPCPGNESVWLHAWPDADLVGDSMAMADGLAMVAVPRSPDDVGAAVPATTGIQIDEGGDVRLTEGDGTVPISNATYVDFTDGTVGPDGPAHKLRPGAMFSRGDELYVPIGFVVEQTEAGLIPEPRDPGNPCAG